MSIRYCQIVWNATPVGDVNSTIDSTRAKSGFFLKPVENEHPVFGKRVLFVNEVGVYECSRDGKDEPKELMDCGPQMLERVKASLA